jgi:hypothetical protein
MKDPYKRGFPQDLPVRPSTSANFDWQADTRNLIDIRLPENLHAKDIGNITMPIREEVSLDWTWHDDYLKSEQVKKDLIKIKARYIPDKGAVYLGLEAENLSSRNWQDVQATICIRLISSPDFADGLRKRTYYWMNKKWNRLERGFPHIAVGPSPSKAFIAVESASGKYVIGTGWQDVFNLGGNDMRHNVCIHADARLGDIASGRIKTTSGMVIFMQGKKEEALDRYLKSKLFN